MKLHSIFLPSLIFLVSLPCHAQQQSPHTAFSQEWHIHAVNPLAYEHQLALAQVIKYYELAAHFDAHTRKSLLFVQKISSDIAQHPTSAVVTTCATLAAHLRALNETLLPQQELWHTRWQLSLEELDKLENEMVNVALAQLQTEGKKLVITLLHELRGSIRNETLFGARTLDTVAYDLAQYAPLYSELFANEEIYAKPEEELDMALRIHDHVDQTIASLQKVTLFSKIFGIQIELKTEEFMKELYQGFSQAIRQEIANLLELDTEIA